MVYFLYTTPLHIRAYGLSATKSPIHSSTHECIFHSVSLQGPKYMLQPSWDSALNPSALKKCHLI